MLRQWHSIMKMAATRLPKIVYTEMQPGTDPWLKEIYSVFTSINASDIFHRNVPVCNFKQFCKYAEEQLMAHYSHTWSLTVESKSKLHFYAEIKSEISTEKYCSVNLKRSQRALVAKLRLGILPIEVELGRHRRVPREERLCSLCSAGAVEDELHILLHCEAHREARYDLFTNANNFEPFNEMGDIARLKLLTSHERLVRRTSIYLSQVLMNRQNLLTI